MLMHTAAIISNKTNYTETLDELAYRLTMKKNMRSDFAFLIVSKSTPKAGNCVVSTLRFLTHMKTMHIADTFRKVLKSLPT